MWAAVDVGVGHHDDLVVAQLVLEGSKSASLADAGAQRGDQRADLSDDRASVDPCLLDIEDLAAQRQDGLVLASRPALAEPPAESPSTMNISDFAGSFSWQSASLPGSVDTLITSLRIVSLALRAASRAAAAW